jgi:hypothetical protein
VAEEVFNDLDPSLQHKVENFLWGVIAGKAPALEAYTDELYEAYTPVRRALPGTVHLYRGEPVDKPHVKRRFISWSPSKRIAAEFATEQGYEIIEADVRSSDVVAVLLSPHNRSYVEYLVLDRKKYHQTGRALPSIGFISEDSRGNGLGWASARSVDFSPDLVKAELPAIERAVQAIGGKVKGVSIDEENEAASITVGLPPEAVGGQDEVQAGPYTVEYLRLWPAGVGQL